MPEMTDLTQRLSPLSEASQDLLERAYAFARRAHDGQWRMTSDPYFVHVHTVACTLADLQMDIETVVAGLLHDTLEDTDTTEEEITEAFGKEISFLVKGVTKLGTLKYRGLERHAESLRKLFIATAQDPRVLIIKLADRLHNAQTLHGHDRPDKQYRIARETLEIYAPLANRLGIGWLKGELEDAAFPYVYPEDHERVKELAKQKRKLNERYIAKARRTLQKEMAKSDVPFVESEARVKRLYSLYQKLIRKDWDIEKIYDIVALRIIVPTIPDCYRVLGIVHSIWTPLPGRIKDYIALPKSNGYQSLHTTVFTGDGGIAEMQIRTEQMNIEANYGITSHMIYKEGERFQDFAERIHAGQKKNRHLEWIGQLLEWQKHVKESGEFLENLKMDFFQDLVFVFTPQGDVIDLPEGSTPVDFAYAIHSDIGNHMSGAKVNGKLKSLDTRLQNGDIVEIVTNKKSHPTTKWLDHAQTTIARKKIRAVLNKTKEIPTL